MTLREWTSKWDYKPGTHESGAVYLVDDLVCGARVELFHLSDYTVSSVTAGVIWLTKNERS